MKLVLSHYQRNTERVTERHIEKNTRKYQDGENYVMWSLMPFVVLPRVFKSMELRWNGHI
jgi:hypothetical protein